MRVYEVAKKYSLTIPKFLQLSRIAGIKFSSHMSIVDENELRKFKQFYTKYTQKHLPNRKHNGKNSFYISHEVFVDALKRISDLTDDAEKFEMKKIQKYYKAGTLSLVLGAGISLSHGIPDWTTLLQKLLAKVIVGNHRHDDDRAILLSKIFTEIYSPNILSTGRYLDNYYSTSFEDIGLAEAVRYALYEHVEDNESDLYKEIARLCGRVKNKQRLNCVITYNYDEILENYLDKCSCVIPYSVVYYEGYRKEKDVLPIYHVHGFLPRLGKIDDDNVIILSESAYHKQYLDIYNWSNLLQINKFRDTNCLFIGCSLKDPNMRRLLDVAKKLRNTDEITHYSFRKKIEIEQICANLKHILKTDNELKDAKISNGLEIEETAKYVCDIIQKYEEDDAESFGVGIIWVESYEDIPKEISKITSKKLYAH